MRVLVLSHNFPNPLNPNARTFVLKQICALRLLGVEIIPVVPTPWPRPPLKFLSHVRKYSAMLRRSNLRQFSVEDPRILCIAAKLAILGLFVLPELSSDDREAGPQKADRPDPHTIMPDGFAAVLLGRELNLPVVCTIHGSDINLYPHRSVASLWAQSGCWPGSAVSLP